MCFHVIKLDLCLKASLGDVAGPNTYFVAAIEFWFNDPGSEAVSGMLTFSCTDGSFDSKLRKDVPSWSVDY